MKALTILNPWPALILLPARDPRHKRVENRTWSTQYRGELLIHAGQSRAMLSGDEDPDLVLEWGKLVGVCELVDCVPLQLQHQARLEFYAVPLAADKRHPWLATHEHTHGPVCWILQHVRKFPEPVKCRGAQGLWNVTGVPLVNVQQQLQEAIAV